MSLLLNLLLGKTGKQRLVNAVGLGLSAFGIVAWADWFNIEEQIRVSKPSSPEGSKLSTPCQRNSLPKAALSGVAAWFGARALLRLGSAQYEAARAAAGGGLVGATLGTFLSWAASGETGNDPLPAPPIETLGFAAFFGAIFLVLGTVFGTVGTLLGRCLKK